MPQTFENPVAKMEGRLLESGAFIATPEGGEFTFVCVGRTGRANGMVLIKDSINEQATQWVQPGFIAGLTIEETGL